MVLVGVGSTARLSNGTVAPRAPIKIPDVIKSYGFSVDAVMNSVKYGVHLPAESGGHKGIIAQCEGRLCVNLEVKADPSHPELTRCWASGVTGLSYNSVVPSRLHDLGSDRQPTSGPYETPYPSSGNPGSDQSSSSPRGRPVLASTISRLPRDRSTLDTAPPEGHCSPQRPATCLPFRTPPNARPAGALTCALRG